MNFKKNILLICYTFPPYPGIGGRRWAKFAKYLAKIGYTVHVICAENPFPNESFYMEDIKSENIIVHPLRRNFPKVLIFGVKNILDKLLYRFALAFLKFKVKGNYYDRAVLWRRQLLKSSVSLIKEHNINEVIVTGAPFSLLYHCLDLKEKFPRIKLYGDFRDPWTTGNRFGIKIISKIRYEFEVRMEKLVVENFQNIFFPVKPMVEVMKSLYSDFSDKFILLQHAFDVEDAPTSPTIIKNKNEKKINLIFYGTLYSESAKEIELIVSFLKQNKQITLQIYTETFSFLNIFEANGLLGNQVFYKKSIAPKLLFEKIKESDYVVFAHPYDPAGDGISTKFYEIINLRVPILFFGHDEYIKQFLTENRIGIFMEHDEKMEFNKMILEFKYNTNFEVNSFSFEYITNTVLITLL